jgi:hypothetical protein
MNLLLSDPAFLSIAAGGLTDPYFSNVSLLLHGDGTNGSTTITDSSSNNFSVIPAGNAQISTAQSKFGGASIALDGSGDDLKVASDAAFGFGTGDFTVEFFLYYTGGNGYVFFFINLIADIANTYIGYGLNNNTKNPWIWSNGNVLTTSTAITNNTWQHHAVVRNGSTITIYLNGSAIGSTTWTPDMGSSKPFCIGSNSGGAQFTAGYIDDFRVTKGVARYTSNFTPPTAPFPDA